MKKIISIFLLIAVTVCGVVSCGETEMPPEITFGVYTSEIKAQTPYVTGEYVPPILYKNFDDLLAYIKADDADATLAEDLAEDSPEQYESKKSVYEHMLREFHNDGFVTYSSHKSAKMNENHFALYPVAKYEDAGIQQNYAYNGFSINVIIYHVNDKVEYQKEDLDDVNFSYLLYRFGTDSFVTKTQKTDVIVEEKIKSAYVKFSEDDPDDEFENSLVIFFIDDTHYVTIKALNPPPKEDLLEFIEGLSFEKISLE